jgi:hypothetical protein
MRVIALGKGSFVARALLDQYNHAVFVDRNWAMKLNVFEKSCGLDIRKFSHIFYFLSQMKGESAELHASNCKLLANFISQLEFLKYKGRFVYFSSLGVEFEDLLARNVYLATKKEAERIVLRSSVDAKVIRLSFPVGGGESTARMLGGICDRLNRDEDVILDSVLFRPTLLSLYSPSLLDFSLSERGPISNAITPLEVQLTEFVHKYSVACNSKSKIELTGKTYDFSRGLESTLPHLENNSLEAMVKEYLLYNSRSIK